MKGKSFWLSLAAIVISFAGGFLLANALNRREIDGLTAEVGRLKAAPPVEAEKDSSNVLSDDEIQQKIADADKNPDDADGQKNLAIALYRYSGATQQSKWLPDIARLLMRVVEKNPKDYNSLVSLGDLYFDLAQNNLKSNPDEAKKDLEQSRDFYKRVLAINPSELQAQTSLGETYLANEPPENEKAIVEFQKSLQLNPKSEKALELITRTLINSGKSGQAEKYFEQLKQFYPNNAALPDLEKQILQPVTK